MTPMDALTSDAPVAHATRITSRQTGAAETRCPSCESPRVVSVVAIPDHEYGLDYQATYACCGECQTLYQSPMPSDAELAGFYKQNYHSMTDGGFLMRMRHTMRVKRLRPLYGGGTGAVLDYGCGNGSFLLRAAEAMPGVEFYGYEVGDAREISRPAERVTLVRGEPRHLLEILPMCRVMIMNHVIEHLSDPFAIVSLLASKLEPGGIFDGQTPNSVSLEHRIFGRFWSGYHAPRHTVVFSRAGLQRLFERAGFEAIRIPGAFNPAAYAVSLASIPHGHAKGVIVRAGLKWHLAVAAAAVMAPIDVLSGAPGIIDFQARKKRA
jgi:SAM-dependent methyltransferase